MLHQAHTPTSFGMSYFVVLSTLAEHIDRLSVSIDIEIGSHIEERRLLQAARGPRAH